MLELFQAEARGVHRNKLPDGGRNAGVLVYPVTAKKRPIDLSLAFFIGISDDLMKLQRVHFLQQ